MSKKRVTLIGEDHRDLSHLNAILKLVEDKLMQSNVVVLALEQDKFTPLIIEQNKTVEEKKVNPNARKLRARPATSIANEIDALPWTHQGTEKYKEMLHTIHKNVPDGKQVIVIGVDDNKIKDTYGFGRDIAMNKNITDAFKIHNVQEVIYPVGSAHIFDSTDQTQGKRLGSLLSKRSDIEIELKNFYAQGSEAYREVQADIDGFKSYNAKRLLEKPKEQVKKIELDAKVKPKKRGRRISSEVDERKKEEVDKTIQDNISKKLKHEGENIQKNTSLQTSPSSLTITLSNTTNIPNLQQHDNTQIEADKRWYGEKEIVEAIRAELSQSANTTVIDPAASSEQLIKSLEQITQNPDGNYLLAMNVNVLSRNFEKDRNNHWVGVHVEKQNDTITNVHYFDPTGMSIDEEVSRNIFKVTNITPVDHKIKLQVGEIKGKGDTAVFEGNDKDCGVFVSNMLSMSAQGNLEKLKEQASSINNLQESEKFGQELRKKYDQDLMSRKRINPVISENIITSDTSSNSQFLSPNVTTKVEPPPSQNQEVPKQDNLANQLPEALANTQEQYKDKPAITSKIDFSTILSLQELAKVHDSGKVLKSNKVTLVKSPSSSTLPPAPPSTPNAEKKSSEHTK